MKLKIAALALAAVTLAASTPASAGSIFGNPYWSDGSKPYNERVIAGSAYNTYSTFIRGVRCHYEYRVVWGSYGKQRIRYEVCN